MAAASAPLMSWSRQSGAPAVLPRTAVASGAPATVGNNGSTRTLELLLPSFADSAPSFLPSAFTPRRPPSAAASAGGASASARLSAAACCGSPRMLGDVPMLISEQLRWSSRATLASPPMGTTDAAFVPMDADGAQARPSWAPASPEESLASILARDGHKTGLIGTNKLHCREASFGADSKFGFDPAERRLCGLGSDAVFRMDADDTDDSSNDDEAYD
jgi:hypothetical protein